MIYSAGWFNRSVVYILRFSPQVSVNWGFWLDTVIKNRLKKTSSSVLDFIGEKKQNRPMCGLKVKEMCKVGLMKTLMGPG